MARQRREAVASQELQEAPISFLNEDEEKLLEGEQPLQRAQAIRALGRLAPYVADLQGIVEELRTTARAHLIGRLANDADALALTLRELGVLHSREVAPLVLVTDEKPEVAEVVPVVDSQLQEESAAAEELPAAVVVPEPGADKGGEREVGQAKDPNSLSEKGDAWLVETFGENWRNMLGVDINEQSSSVIAAALLGLVPGSEAPVKQRRIELYFAGHQWAEIGKILGETSAAGQVFLSGIRKRLRESAQTKGGVEPTATKAPRQGEPTPTEVEAPSVDEPARREQQLSFEEREELVLVTSIQRPSVVTPAEWRREAEAHLVDVAVQRQVLTLEETTALWSRLHFDDDDAYKADLPATARQALNRLQERLVAHRELFSTSKEKEVSIKMLLNTALGVKSLDDIHQALKRIDPSLTANVAQRYVTAAVLELINAG